MHFHLQICIISAFIPGAQEDLWNVQASQAKEDYESDSDAAKVIVVPKVTELENNKHMRSTYK